MLLGLSLQLLAGKPAADFRSLLVDTAAVAAQVVAPIFDDQVKMTVQSEFKSRVPNFFKPVIFRFGQFYARKSPATVGVAS